MQIDWFTFFAQIVNFLILLTLLRYFLYGPIQNVMEKREQDVRLRLEEAQAKLTEAERKSSQYDAKLQDLEDHKDGMLTDAREEAEAKKLELIGRARTEADQMQRRWEEALRNEQESFRGELYRQTSRQILSIVERIIRDLSNKQLEDLTVEKFISKLSEATRKNEKHALKGALDSGAGEIKVVTSFELSDAQKERIQQALNELFSLDITCRFSLSKLLGFGIEVRLPGWKFGWNAHSYIEEVEGAAGDIFERERGTKLR